MISIKKILICLFSVIPTSVNITTPKSAVLMDLDSGRVLYEKNANERNLTASIVKVLTAIIAIELGDLDKEITVSKEATNQVGSSLYLKEGEKIKLYDLLAGMLLRSGNDAAYQVATEIGGSIDGFVHIMNEYAKMIGMKNSTFENPTGLDEESKNYSTAYDMALLMKYAMNNPKFRELTNLTKFQSPNLTYPWITKHRLVRENNSLYTGGKTGYTKKAGRTLITTSSKDGKNLVVVTFNDPDDWNTHKALINYGFENFDKKTLLKSKLINLSDSDKYYYIDSDISCLIQKNEDKKLNIVIDNSSLDLYLYSDKNLLLKTKVKEKSIYMSNKEFFTNVVNYFNN